MAIDVDRVLDGPTLTNEAVREYVRSAGEGSHDAIGCHVATALHQTRIRVADSQEGRS